MALAGLSLSRAEVTWVVTTRASAVWSGPGLEGLRAVATS